MRNTVTTVLSMLILFLLVGEAAAQQDVTVREINAIPQANIDAVNAAGDALTNGEINPGFCTGLLYAGTLCGQDVRFTAVVMSDPLNSGLASVNNGVVYRIHVFVRDVSADVDGPLGMGIQVVDGSNAFGLENLLKGDVVVVIGEVDPFFSTIQITPTAIDPTGEFRAAGDPIFDPIVVTTSDVNKVVGPDGAIQVNWDNLPDIRGSLVRFENATVLQRTLGDRVDWNFSSDGGASSVSMYDTSIRYRNDRDDYPSNFNTHTSTYEPPPPGATINIEGFITYNGVTASDPFSLAVPNGAALAINPMDDSDVEVTEAPISVANIQRPSVVPGAGPTEVIADIVVDPSRFIASAKLNFTSTSNPGGGSVNPSGVSGDTYTFNLPGQADGDFGQFWFTATDNGGGAFESDRFSFRTLFGGITKIEHIQRTVDDKEGDGPFRNWTVDLDLTVTVQVDPATGDSFVQDDTAPWSGIFIRSNPLSGLNRGDVIRITRARMDESFGLTRMRDITFEMVSTGGDPLDHVTLTTNVLQDQDIAESYEGMLVNVDDPFVTATNSDDPSGPFGEFDISSDGDPDNALRVDDRSRLIEYGVEGTDSEDDPGTVFSVFEQLDFVRGALYYSFGNFKLEPESLARDVGAVINVGTESDNVPERFALKQNFPNPFNPTTSIRYEIPTSGLVTLDVFDSLGRRVRSLVNREQLAGSYEITFDAKSLASGVYLYKLTAVNEVISRTMILLK
ncbi:MAG: T9SS type A sorting domain-containing protein [Bacteroidetes bacterium]|nr:T9SS type A sorting domain-containing protein [Bacteroidota bacterium]